MLIAIDHGNSRIKTIESSFVSGFTKFGNEPPMARDVIRFGDSYYALTETRFNYEFDKTGTEDFYILTLFAIAKEIKKRNAFQPQMDIELAVGLPPIHYGLLKQKFADYLMRDRQQVSFVGAGNRQMGQFCQPGSTWRPDLPAVADADIRSGYDEIYLGSPHIPLRIAVGFSAFSVSGLVSQKKKLQGEVFTLYLAIYGLGRCFIEGLRTDSLYLGPLRVSQWVAGICFSVFTSLFIVRRVRHKSFAS